MSSTRFSPEREAQQQFVDAVREMLGLDPLYPKYEPQGYRGAEHLHEPFVATGWNRKKRTE